VLKEYKRLKIIAEVCTIIKKQERNGLISSGNVESCYKGNLNSIYKDKTPKWNPLKKGDDDTFSKNGIRIPTQTPLFVNIVELCCTIIVELK